MEKAREFNEFLVFGNPHYQMLENEIVEKMSRRRKISKDIPNISPFPFERRPPPPGGIPGDIEFFYTVKTVISTVKVTMAFFLLINYVSIYRKTKSEFTIRLIIFSGIFLLNALASNPLVISAFGYRAFGLGPFALLPDLFTFAALAVLLYLSVNT